MKSSDAASIAALLRPLDEVIAQDRLREIPAAWKRSAADKPEVGFRVELLRLPHGICHDGPTRAERPGTVQRRIVRSLMLDLRV